MLNTAAAQFDDPRVRQAFTLAIDYPALVADAGGALSPATGLYPSSAPYTLNTQRTDRARAAQLLSEAGWRAAEGGIRTRSGQPLRVTVVYAPRSTPDHEALVVALAAQLKPLGFAPQTAVVDRNYRGYIPNPYGIPVSGSMGPSQ